MDYFTIHLKGLRSFLPGIWLRSKCKSFKKEYPKPQIIIDVTKFSVQLLSSLSTQASTFSAYKNRYTIKILIGITASSVILFVQNAIKG